MENVKHTPGPWVGMNEYGLFNGIHGWDATNDEYNFTEVAPIWGDGKVIALVVHGQNEYYPGANPIIAANARLIAVAPELLKRLDELCETVIELEKKTILSALDVERFQNARAAIAKATGGA